MAKIKDTASNIMLFCYQNIDVKLHYVLDYATFNVDYPSSVEEYLKAVYYLLGCGYINDVTHPAHANINPNKFALNLSARLIDVVEDELLK